MVYKTGVRRIYKQRLRSLTPWTVDYQATQLPAGINSWHSDADYWTRLFTVMCTSSFVTGCCLFHILMRTWQHCPAWSNIHTKTQFTAFEHLCTSINKIILCSSSILLSNNRLCLVSPAYIQATVRIYDATQPSRTNPFTTGARTLSRRYPDLANLSSLLIEDIFASAQPGRSYSSKCISPDATTK